MTNKHTTNNNRTVFFIFFFASHSFNVIPSKEFNLFFSNTENRNKNKERNVCKFIRKFFATCCKKKESLKTEMWKKKTKEKLKIIRKIANS